MNSIILIEIGFESNSLEEERHILQFVFFCEFRKYCFIFSTIFSTEIERSSHPSEEDWDIFCLYFLDDLSQIFLDILYRLPLECIIGTDTEDDESKTPSIPLVRGRRSIKRPVETREESCGRVS